MRIRLSNPRNFHERLMGGAGLDLVIPRSVESQHIQVSGDNGAGKTVLLQGMCDWIDYQGETAIILDPKREFVPIRYRPERGDMILNPMDNRVWHWVLANEAISEAEFMAPAVGLLPEKPYEQAWFNEHARAMLAYLLHKYHPPIEELCAWLSEELEMDRRLKGSIHAVTLTENAAPQRAGILGTLNKIGQALRMMPLKSEGRPEWSVRDWCAGNREGWIFITATPQTQDALQPLMSLWIDMFILALQAADRQPHQKRVWTIMDEVTNLNVLPKLRSGLTMNRASDNPIVLGFQSMAMFSALYGEKQAEAMLSQAYSNFILRAREPRTAKHLSDLIGQREVERVSETWTPSGGASRQSYVRQRVVEPLVMDSQIQGLKKLEGYFVQADMVVKIKFKPVDRPQIAERLIKREIPEPPAVEVKVDTQTHSEPKARPYKRLAASEEEVTTEVVTIPPERYKPYRGTTKYKNGTGQPYNAADVGWKDGEIVSVRLTCKRCRKIKEFPWDQDSEHTIASIAAENLWDISGESKDKPSAFCPDCKPRETCVEDQSSSFTK